LSLLAAIIAIAIAITPLIFSPHFAATPLPFADISFSLSETLPAADYLRRLFTPLIAVFDIFPYFITIRLRLFSPIAITPFRFQRRHYDAITLSLPFHFRH